MPAYVVLQRNPEGDPATWQHLIDDLRDYEVRLRGVLYWQTPNASTHHVRDPRTGHQDRHSLIAISTARDFPELEARLTALASKEDHDQDAATPHDAKSRAWYRSIRLWLPDEHPENTIFSGIAKDLLSAELRGR